MSAGAKAGDANHHVALDTGVPLSRKLQLLGRVSGAWLFSATIATLLTVVSQPSAEQRAEESLGTYAVVGALILTFVWLPVFLIAYLYCRKARPPIDEDPRRRYRVAYLIAAGLAVFFAASMTIAAALDGYLAASIFWMVASIAVLLWMYRERPTVGTVDHAEGTDVAVPAARSHQSPTPPPRLPTQPFAPPPAPGPTPTDVDSAAPQEVERGHVESVGAKEVRELIASGESQSLEFKSTARFNLHTSKPDKKLEHVITKTVCGFLNADGGTLLIGVNDDGEPVGLGNDYGTLGKRQDRDHYELWLRQHLNATLSIPTAGMLRVTFETLEGHDVCLVEVQRSRKAVFARPPDGGSGKATEFWVRSGNATNQLVGDDMIHYQSHHWGWWQKS